MFHRSRIRRLELDVLALAQSTQLLLYALTDVVPRDDGAAIRFLEQEKHRTQEIIDHYANATIWVDNGR